MNLKKIAVVGLGYTGLPLAVEFGKKFSTIGYDFSIDRINMCLKHKDPSKEISVNKMKSARHITYTNDVRKLATADFIFVCVPTPVNESNAPDLNPLILASKNIGKNLKKGAIIVYQSTVYPGVTEDICIPLLESESKYKWKKDFFVAYSPERINPGDSKHTISNVVKIVSGDTPKTLKIVSMLLKKIVKVSLHHVDSIKEAEASKVIENVQRDINIALINELAIIFGLMDIDTHNVLNAASTKWNFTKFSPGLVGGHCIGVDPYYLTYKAQLLGYQPEIILAGRRINNSMGKYVAQNVIKRMIVKGLKIKKIKLIILGATYKENCADIRNSKVFDIVKELESNEIQVSVTDPHANAKDVKNIYDIQLVKFEKLPKADAIILAVAHNEYVKSIKRIVKKKLKKNGILFDVKSATNLKYHKLKDYSVYCL